MRERLDKESIARHRADSPELVGHAGGRPTLLAGAHVELHSFVIFVSGAKRPSWLMLNATELRFSPADWQRHWMPASFPL